MPALEEASAGLFDCYCGLGLPASPVGAAFSSAGELLASMDYYGIAEALVYSVAALECDANFGNQRLLEEVADHPRLHPSWVVVPGPNAAPDVQVAAVVAARVRAVRIAPTDHGIVLSGGLLDGLLSALELHRVPLFVDFGLRHWSDNQTDWGWVDRACTTHPRLPLVLTRQALGATPSLVCLLERHRNLHLDTSFYQPCGGLAALCERGLAGQLVFGTGMPFADASLPVAALAYSRADKQSRIAIGSGNLRRLIEDVRW